MRVPVDYSFPAPDFTLSTDYGTVLVEAATANHPSGGDAEWDALRLFDKIKTRKPSSVVDLASIRLVNTITAKHKLYLSSYNSQPHVGGNPFVLAVAPFDQPHFFAQNSEAIHRVLYGFRARRVIRGGEPETSIIRETQMRKPNGAPIPLGLFADDSMKQISAVLFSTTATTGKVRALSRDSGAVLFGVVRFRKHELTPSFDVLEKDEYKETLFDGLSVYHNPFATHELDSRAFHFRGISQHWYDPRTGLPSDNSEDGSLIQRFCIKLMSKGHSSCGAVAEIKALLKTIDYAECT
jgi:hypothetical protein